MSTEFSDVRSFFDLWFSYNGQQAARIFASISLLNSPLDETNRDKQIQPH